jgi:2-polyprenyl-6-methoxyphenol hydroxylase-like FAD-dependent oxidoreductase
MKIIISGVGIAGPALAYWLRKSGHDVVLVEKAPALRQGGYIIDFWGIGYDIAEKMGLIPRIRELGYLVRDVLILDRKGRRSGGFSVDVFARATNGRYTSLPRTALSTAIYDALDSSVEKMFGDSITGIAEEGDHVSVSFEHAAPRDFDLVIGADGLHSRVRELAFGPESEFALSLGHHVAGFEIEGYRPRNELVYVSRSMPGRQMSRFSMRGDRTMFLFVVRDEYLTAADPSGDRDPKAVLRDVFADIGWEGPQILDAMDRADDLYFDTVSQIRMARWSKGRVALVGDAAACVSLLAGEGTGLALAEAYVLAGELHAAGGDHVAAFARYQERMMPFLRSKQESAAKFASAFAPATRFGLAFRDFITRLMRIPFVAKYFIGRNLQDDFELPDYRF